MLLPLSKHRLDRGCVLIARQYKAVIGRAAADELYHQPSGDQTEPDIPGGHYSHMNHHKNFLTLHGTDYHATPSYEGQATRIG